MLKSIFNDDVSLCNQEGDSMRTLIIILLVALSLVIPIRITFSESKDMNAILEIEKKRQIFVDYHLFPKQWSEVERTVEGICGDAGIKGFREVGKNLYEIMVFQGVTERNDIMSWVPVVFRDGFFQYTFYYYQCPDLTPQEARELGMMPNCPWQINVKGEIITGEPPMIKFTGSCEPKTLRTKQRKEFTRAIVKMRSQPTSLEK